MLRERLPRYAAAFFGFAVFMPVGVNYLGFVLVLAALLAGGDLRARWQRLRAHPVWWPVVAYVAWTLVVLLLRPHYKETGNDLAHGLRIPLTMLVALALTRQECVWALRGFLLATAVGLALIALNLLGVLPDVQIWRAWVSMQGNKSINNALLFSIVGAAAGALGLAHLHDARRWHWAGPAFAVTALMAALVAVVLPSRTSLLAMLVCIFAAAVHQWRGHWRGLLLSLLAASSIAALGVWQAPDAMKAKFELGVQEIEEAQAGAVSEGSWITRYYMYRETSAMMMDAPVAGLGIGAWISEWKKRGPKILDYKNMPHNDYLWMGAQAGIPGLLSLLAIVLTATWVAWRRPDITGRIGLVGILTLLLATSVNSAMRDAQIGLSLVWITFLMLRLVQEAGNPLQEVLPRHLAGLADERLPGRVG